MTDEREKIKDRLTWSWAGEVGRPFAEPIVMVPGNAKARRRWRRRNVPNTQRPSSNMVAQSMVAWNAADDDIADGIATWQADVEVRMWNVMPPLWGAP